MTDKSHRAAIIGAGWAGCAAAVELARSGWHVTLFERARTLGGRARMVDLEGRALDNGQHILLGAYKETLRLMNLVGLRTEEAFLRLPLQMRYSPHEDGMDFIAPRLPAPLHLLVALLRSKGLGREDRMALARFSTTARWMGWQLHQDCSVADLLQRFDQTERLNRLMWRPLCIAALNTPPERASAQVFLNVLRDSLGAARAASDMLIPRLDLSALFPQAAAAFVERHGGTVRVGCAVEGIIDQDMPAQSRQWNLRLQGDTQEQEEAFDALVIATGVEQAADLLGGLPEAAALPAFEYEPITTCYLQYEPHIRLPQPFLALLDDPQDGRWGQFVFDRGQFTTGQDGLLAVVVSVAGDAVGQGREALAAALARQLAQALGMPELLQPQWSKVITEKRATFACAPGLARPQADAAGLGNLLLAGDYIASDYPATLEAAVQSGVSAARLAVAAY